MAVEALALAVLALLVVGLLRSHAEILRRLHELGINLDDDGAGHRHASTGVTSTVAVSPPSPRAHGDAAPALVGVTPFDEAVTVAPSTGDKDTVLAFLTTGCTSCQPFWKALSAKAAHHGRRVVVVTRGPGDESVGAARGLAGDANELDVVMSSDAWSDYGVPGAPYFVHVSGRTGKVTGEGTGRTWEQVLELLDRADLDDTGPNGPWSTDAEREARIDRELEAAGIRPGDPRLFHEPTTAD